jgi:phasin family protein
VSKTKEKLVDQAKLVADSTKAVENVVNASKAQFDGLLKASTEAAEKLMSASKERFETAVKGYDEVSTFNKETVEALVNAGTLTAKSFETLNAEVLAFAKAQMEETITASKSIMGAKTVQELFDLQSEYAKSAYDGLVAQSNKIGELATKLTKEAVEPLTARFQVMVEKIARPVAA